MQLTIDGRLRPFTDIREFRKAHDLPDDFGVARFEPKDYTGLASLEHAGDALKTLRQTTLEVLPPEIEYLELIKFMDKLAQYFRLRLNLVNDQIKLKEEEIEFAVNGFDALCQRITYAIINARNTRMDVPAFDAIYQDWLDESVRVSQRVHEYPHQGETWRVNIINNVYGRVGLIIAAEDAVYYVADGALACPADSFMYNLLKTIDEHVNMVLK